MIFKSPDERSERFRVRNAYFLKTTGAEFVREEKLLNSFGKKDASDHHANDDCGF
ncbi:hypothetical protein [Kaistella daneshvariae]|uniref:hypothetical protein n=1 Tax=Kaistella daneshvariae TaxID=2487074 RepID=UPI001FD57671|nr:hypothetical protein [Kaistella daneshvariae]